MILLTAVPCTAALLLLKTVRMNVTFRLTSEELESKFIKEATEANFIGVKGHRSVGGCRASIYNAMPVEGVKELAKFMRKFEEDNS